MLGETAGSELFWSKRNQTVRKGNAMWIWIQLPKSHENFNKKINFWFTMKLPKIIQTSTFIIKKLKTYPYECQKKFRLL